VAASRVGAGSAGGSAGSVKDGRSVGSLTPQCSHDTERKTNRAYPRRMDFSIPSELAETRRSLVDFVDREVRPVEERFQQKILEDVFDDEMHQAGVEIRKRSAQVGFYGAHLPEEVGGWGLSALGTTLLVETVGSRGLRFGSYVLGPPNPEAPTPLLLQLQEPMRSEVLGPLMRGETQMCFALTEPDAGSDAQNIRTRADRDGDHFVLNGVKHFITGGAQADVAVVFAVTDADKRAQGGITAFLVDSDTPGFSVGKHQRTMAGDTHQVELIFDDCRVPADRIIGQEGFGFYGAMSFLNAGRAFIGAMCVGLAQYCLDTAVAYAKERTAFGRPIGKNQGVSFQLADSAIEIEAARWLTYRLAWLVDQGEQPMAEASMVKVFDTEMAGRVADRSVQVLGGMGYLTEGRVERVYRLVRMFRIVEGTSEIQRMLVARSLGL
jgi:alkylation response protein AidB-like acyl-CoA dehydrogenase